MNPDNTPTSNLILDRLRLFFENRADIEIAVLVGSRSHGTAGENSDWDIAVQWRRDIPLRDTLGYGEKLRAEMADSLHVMRERIDLIDIPSARLAMRAVVAEEGVLLKGDNTLPWSHFLLRTWGDLEDFYWGRRHAA